MGGIAIDNCNATFQQFMYPLIFGLGASKTGVIDGTGSDYIYPTALPTSSLPNTKSGTIQGGDNQEQEVMEYALCTELKITGGAGKELKHSWILIGRQVQQLGGGFTGSVAIPTVEDVLFQRCKVYLDATSGTYGTTQVANSIYGIELTFKFMWSPIFTADGVLYYGLANFTGWSATGKLSYLHTTTASGTGGAKQFYRNQTAKLLAIDFGGNAVVTPGTTYSTTHLIFQLPIKFTKIGVLGDNEGNSTVDFEFQAGYDTTAGNAGNIIVVNELATIP
jgi:hypothetical protein